MKFITDLQMKISELNQKNKVQDENINKQNIAVDSEQQLQNSILSKSNNKISIENLNLSKKLQKLQNKNEFLNN